MPNHSNWSYWNLPKLPAPAGRAVVLTAIAAVLAVVGLAGCGDDAATGAAGDAQARQPAALIMPTDGAPSRGSKDAPVTMVEFSDYQCPFCARYTLETLPQIDKEYIRTGKVRYVFRDFPLIPIHPQAFKAHEAARCAGDQGKYWEMHDRLYENYRSLAPANLVDHARAVGLEMPRFERCLDGGAMTATVQEDLDLARMAGVTGTPAFFIGTTRPDGSVVVVSRVAGAHPYEVFKEAIDKALGM
jgi:protein-disulfide isomerase